MFGMAEAGEQFRLALEAGQTVGVVREGLGQRLDRDVAAESRVARAIDLTHAAGAERREDLVGAEAGTGRD